VPFAPISVGPKGTQYQSVLAAIAAPSACVGFWRQAAPPSCAQFQLPPATIQAELCRSFSSPPGYVVEKNHGSHDGDHSRAQWVEGKFDRGNDRRPIAERAGPCPASSPIALAGPGALRANRVPASTRGNQQFVKGKQRIADADT